MVVALYARVSTTKQAEKDLSIPDQFRQMREWCKQHGYSVAVEYKEPGATATDDRRPAFQQMISEACVSPSPFDAIIVHSLSRFFRDSLEFGLYERQLNKHGVKLISITQQTSDDPAGEMARRIFSLFDEYQSKENSKHTLRAMKENARRGYFNGNNPPFGYKAVEIDAAGNKGKKKKLKVDISEAALVYKIFSLYIHGQKGQIMGTASIAAHLNSRDTFRRGKKWSKSTIHYLLTNETYIGKYHFNKKNSKTRQTKPKEEWILVQVPPIIEQDIFDRVQRLIEERSPVNTPPRVVNSPTLLTGLLKCSCGASMTIATGKGGRYRYYKCTSRISKGKDSCQSKNIPMEKLDTLILDAAADKIFSPERVAKMLKEFQARLKNSRSQHDEHLQQLKNELDAIEQASNRLLEAVENGILPLDQTLKERAHRNQAKRQEILTEIAGLKRQKEMPVKKLSQKNIKHFCQALRTRLQDREANFGKEYLKLLVDEIRVDGKEVRVTGSYAALAGAIEKTKAGNSSGVPTFGVVWLPLLGSNQRQSD